MTITEILKQVYTANQCTDINDCQIALNKLSELGRGHFNNDWPASLRKRNSAIHRKMKRLGYVEKKWNHVTIEQILNLAICP